MKKMKEMKFHLATGLLILASYLIFNVVMHPYFTNTLSDEFYYVFQVVLVFILGTIATIILVKSEHWKECGRFQFRWSYLGVFILSFFLLFVWVNLASRIFPRTQNGSAVVEVATSLTGISYFITRVLYGSLIAPVAEEVVCRGFVMQACLNSKTTILMFWFLQLYLALCMFYSMVG